MSAVKNGDTVKVHYTGALKNGETFDSSAVKDPLEFKVGKGQVIPDFDKGLLDMAVGEDLDPQIGQMLQSVQEDGNRIEVKVTDVTDTNVTLDANHPLAGKDLIFAIELMEIG